MGEKTMGSKMNRMVLLYMLILSMVSLPTSLPKHLLVKTATDPPAINDYVNYRPVFDYSESHRGPKKNYKKELTKITDDMKRQGKDYGGFTDFLKEAVEVVGPAWKVVGPALKKGFNAVMGQLKKGSENSDKTEEVAKKGDDYCCFVWGR